MTRTRVGSQTLVVPDVTSELAHRVPTASVDYLILLPVVAIGALILAGEAYGSATLMLVGAGAAFLAAVLSPTVGFATFMFLAPLNPPSAIPAPGFSTILVALILVGCLYRLPIDRPSFRPTAPLLLLLGFMLYVTAQQLPELMSGYAGETAHLVGFYFIQLLTGLGAILAGAYVLRQRRPQPFIVAGIAAALIAAFLALATFDSLSVQAPLAGLLARPDETARAVGPFANPNYFGQFEATAIVAIGAWFLLARSRGFRLLLVATAVPLAAALAVSLSRGAAVTAFAGLIALTLLKNRRLGVALILASVLVVLVVYPAYISWRFGFTNPGSVEIASILAASDGSRAQAVLAGGPLFLSSPLVGVGFGHYSFATAQIAGIVYGQSAHNWYVKELAEGGVVGMAIWMGLLVTVTLSLWRRPAKERLLGIGLLTTFAVGSMFAEPPSSFQTSAFEAMILVAALVSVWDRREADERPERPRSHNRDPASAVATPHDVSSTS